MSEDIMEHDDEPHPWYGPCDGLGPSGECAECKRVELKDEVAFTAWLRRDQQHRVQAAFVIGGWDRITDNDPDLLRAIHEGIEASPVAEVRITKGLFR